ncbi:MAG: MBG domain-containing protein, partial [Pseudomonadota bacterium]
RGLSGVMSGDVVAYTGGTATFADKNAATGKTVTATGLSLSGADAANYSVNSTATTSANITPANLTITANNATKVQGDSNPVFTSNMTGFVGGDTEAVLIDSLDYYTLADTGSSAGTYTVTPLGVTASNYSIAFVDGILRVATSSKPSIGEGLENTGDNISVFNNAITRPEQATQMCGQSASGQAMINGLDAFGVDEVDYEPSIGQPLVGGVVANALVGSSCLKL